MAMVKKILHRVHNLPHSLKSAQTIRSLGDGDYLTEGVPYQCQFATPDLTGKILDGDLEASNDPNWKIFGYKTAEEAAYWTMRQCGICCVKIALDRYGVHKTVAELTEQGLKLGGYDKDNDRGWFYKPLVALAEKYGAKGRVFRYLTVESVAKELMSDKLVVMSVNPQIIRGDKKITNHEKSGHLVVAVGFKLSGRRISGVYIHNPSGRTQDMREYAFIPSETIQRSFGNRGFLLSKR